MQESERLTRCKKAETANLVKELWQGVPIEEAEIRLPEEQNVVSAEITALDTALFEEEKKVSRRSVLAESLPETEMSLTERDKDITTRSIALEADRASLNEKKNQRNAAKESLRFDNIAEAQRKSEALGKAVSEMKKAYDNAQSALSDSDKKLPAIMLQLQNSPSSSLPIVILTRKQKQRRKRNYPKRELRMTMLPKRFILA